MAIKVGIWEQTPACKVVVRRRHLLNTLCDLEQRIALCVPGHVAQNGLDKGHARIRHTLVRPMAVAKQRPLAGFDLVHERGNIFRTFNLHQSGLGGLRGAEMQRPVRRAQRGYHARHRVRQGRCSN